MTNLAPLADMRRSPLSRRGRDAHVVALGLGLALLFAARPAAAQAPTSPTPPRRNRRGSDASRPGTGVRAAAAGSGGGQPTGCHAGSGARGDAPGPAAGLGATSDRGGRNGRPGECGGPVRRRHVPHRAGRRQRLRCASRRPGHHAGQGRATTAGRRQGGFRTRGSPGRAASNAAPPAGATMRCKDGTYLGGAPSDAACAGHGGLAAALPAPRQAPAGPARVRRP